MEQREFPDETQVAEQHSAIRVVMQWIDTTVARKLDSREIVPGDNGLLGPLRSFREHLLAHFAFEEQSGAFSAALARTPDAEAALHEWVGQHRDLARRVDEAVLSLELYAREGIPVDRAFYENLRQIFADVREHDRFENRILGSPRSWTFRTYQSALETHD